MEANDLAFIRFWQAMESVYRAESQNESAVALQNLEEFRKAARESNLPLDDDTKRRMVIFLKLKEWPRFVFQKNLNSGNISRYTLLTADPIEATPRACISDFKNMLSLADQFREVVKFDF